MINTMPEGWAIAPLKDLGLVKPQGIRPNETPDMKFELWSVPSYPSDYPEVLFGSEIGSNKIIVQPGDVLLCKINPRINRVWHVKPTEVLQQIASTEWIVFRTDFIDAQFFMFRLKEQSFRNKICSNVSGVGGSLTRARPQIVKEIKLSLPPLPEQKRIATKIDTLQAKSKKAREALEAARPLLDKLRQSILAAAFRGDLTANWRKQNPDVKPAVKLLERIRIERRQKWEEAELAKMRAKGKEPKNDKWKARYKEPEPVDATGLPDLPDGWCWAKFDELLVYVTSGSRGWGKFYSENGPIFIRAQDIKTDKLLLDQVARVSLPPNVEGTRTLVQPEDLLVTITGANVTKAAIAPIAMGEAYVSQHVALCRPVLPEVVKLFHLWLVSKMDGRKQLLTAAYGGGKPGLNLANIRDVVLALPPLAEQAVLLKRVEKFLLGIDEISVSICEQFVRLTQLDQSILAKAFRGELVPQDPNDEPASVLLERIKTERETAKPNKKRQRKKT